MKDEKTPPSLDLDMSLFLSGYLDLISSIAFGLSNKWYTSKLLNSDKFWVQFVPPSLQEDKKNKAILLGYVRAIQTKLGVKLLNFQPKVLSFPGKNKNSLTPEEYRLLLKLSPQLHLSKVICPRDMSYNLRQAFLFSTPESEGRKFTFEREDFDAVAPILHELPVENIFLNIANAPDQKKHITAEQAERVGSLLPRLQLKSIYVCNYEAGVAVAFLKQLSSVKLALPLSLDLDLSYNDAEVKLIADALVKNPFIAGISVPYLADHQLYQTLFCAFALSQLKYVSIGEGHVLSDESYYALIDSLPRTLEKISIVYCGMNDAHLVRFCEKLTASNIEKLTLEGNLFSDANSLVSVVKTTPLKKLSLYRGTHNHYNRIAMDNLLRECNSPDCILEELNVSECHMGDDIAYIPAIIKANNPRLRELGLCSTFKEYQLRAINPMDYHRDITEALSTNFFITCSNFTYLPAYQYRKIYDDFVLRNKHIANARELFAESVDSGISRNTLQAIYNEMDKAKLLSALYKNEYTKGHLQCEALCKDLQKSAERNCNAESAIKIQSFFRMKLQQNRYRELRDAKERVMSHKM